MYFRTELVQSSRDIFLFKAPSGKLRMVLGFDSLWPNTDSDNQGEMKYDNDCRTIDVLREQRHQGVPAEKSQQQCQERDYSHPERKQSE